MAGEAAGLDAGTLAWAARPGVRRVLAEARRRAERRTLGTRGHLSVALDAAERRDVGVLLGSGWEIGDTAVPIALLRNALGRRDVMLEDLLVAVGGPIRDIVGEREQASMDRHTEETSARQVLSDAVAGFLSRLGTSVPDPSATVDEVSEAALPRAGSGARLRRAEQLARVLDLLDAQTAVLLPVLAAQAFGDAHALDRTRPLGRAAARMVAMLAAEPGVRPQVGTTEEWRAAWAGVGVACDRVSSTVLVLNLPLTGSAGLAAVTGIRGEPVWLTARMLDAGVAVPDDIGPVHVCENPSVAEAAADTLGEHCRPLVCTYGRPSLAAMTLMRALHENGIQVFVSADHDRGGDLVREAVRAACPGARDWAAGGGTFEEERLDGLLHDLRRT